MSSLKTMYAAQPNSPYTTTLGEISSTDTAVLVSDVSVLPSNLPFLLTFGFDKSASETVLVTAISGNTLTITRGVDGNALLWVAGTKAARIFTAKDLNDAQENIRALNRDKQENLTFDSTPTSGSQNPVTSDGIRAALNLKANNSSLSSHTGNKNNPHQVTAAQVGAATPSQVDSAIREVSDIGDMKTTVGSPNADWLICDGSGIYSRDYPDLVPILQNKNPTAIDLNIKKEGSALGENSPYLRDAYFYGDRWVMIGTGYRLRYISGQSSYLNIPLIYTTTDIYGEWKEIRLSTEKFELVGVCYDTNWGYWVAYGYKIVSDTECYPYYFYASDPEGTWQSRQISSTVCKLTCGHYADGKLVLYGLGCTDTTQAYAYTFIAERYMSFTETNFTTAFPTSWSRSIRRAAFGNGYWAFVDNEGSVWYSADPAGPYTQNVVVSSGVQLRDICYGGGSWCIVGMQNSGGSGRIFRTQDITKHPTDTGVLAVNDGFDTVAYSDGIFVAVTDADYSISTDNCITWKEKRLSQTSVGNMFANNHHWLVPGIYRATLLRYPEADAVLPQLSPELGATYIKAK